MMKLNKRGYLTVEIILSSVIATMMAFFLITLTMKFINKNEDTYLDTILVTDKALITKNIMELVGEKGVSRVEKRGNGTFVLTFSDGDTQDLIVTQADGQWQVVFGDYIKKLNKNLTKIKISGKDYDDFYNIKVSTKTIYSDTDYGFNINVLYS